MIWKSFENSEVGAILSVPVLPFLLKGVIDNRDLIYIKEKKMHSNKIVIYSALICLWIKKGKTCVCVSVGKAETCAKNNFFHGQP